MDPSPVNMKSALISHSNLLTDDLRVVASEISKSKIV